jgi:hypothetical protein
MMVMETYTWYAPPDFHASMGPEGHISQLEEEGEFSVKFIS